MKQIKMWGGEEIDVVLCRTCNRAVFPQDMKKYRGCAHCGASMFIGAKELHWTEKLRYCFIKGRPV